MDAFFRQLGNTVSERWKAENFSLSRFPEIACAALKERPPSEHLDVPAFIKDFLLNDEQAFQTQSGFGQPEVVVYDHPRFYIQILFWLDGTTDIHQHEFSGAFHVLAGSSIHADFAFENVQPVTAHFQMGDLRRTNIELLKTGSTVPVISGKRCIHSLFHLDTPSVSVVVRTQHDPGTGPQFNFLPPHVAFDPVFSDPLGMRRLQLLDVLELTGDSTYPERVREMIADLDFERGFFVLQHSMDHLQHLGEWDATLEAYQKKHGELANGVAPTLEETVRRNTIKDLRSTITEPEHRFFLALLLNVETRADILKFVAERFPEEPPIKTVLRWAEELGQETDFGTAILDAYFPETLDAMPEEQPDILMAALQHFLEDGKKLPPILGKLPAADLQDLRATFTASSLRILVLREN